jgi:hypothetical protein
MFAWRFARVGVLLYALALPAVPVPPEDWVVVVSADVPVTNLSLDHLRRLFLFRERYWKPGLPVTVVLSGDDLDAGSFVLQKIYRMDYTGLRRLIFERLYQQEIDLPPKVVASDGIAVEIVASGRGLVSIVRAASLPGGNLRILSVDGVQPGGEGYALRR